MAIAFVPVWKEAPFIRLAIPFIMGIGIQWYIGLPLTTYWISIASSFTLVSIFPYIRSFLQFKHYWITGVFINVLLANTGGILAWYKDIRHHHNWMGYRENERSTIIATLQEPLSRKARSFKASASVDYILIDHSWKKVKGNIILYFALDSSMQKLSYHSSILFCKRLQRIRNTGNPGAFDYERYCAFQGIYHQAFLKGQECVILPNKNKDGYNDLLFSSRRKVLTILRLFIPGEKEAGLAEALLIGYKDDLDKNLVQSYSNTGVIHVIAISGLHVGLIYWLLKLFFKPMRTKKITRWINAAIIIMGLWAFGFLAGGAPSVLRSTVMFSFIVLGETTRKRSSVYNSLASSAFLLLCFNPFWIWDVGFQLSYIAVLSIVVYMRPVYNWFFIRNKLLDYLWKIGATSIAAQILTTPISIYHFHQFPIYFLMTNVVAVPLSGLIVLTEILLCVLSFLPNLAHGLGYCLYCSIKWMNVFITHMEHLPFSVWGQLQVSLTEVVLSYISAIACGAWLMHKNKFALLLALSSLCLSLGLQREILFHASQQEKLIVYNVPGCQAIDLVNGQHFSFLGDSVLEKNVPLQNFYLKPSRTFYHLEKRDTLQLLNKGPIGFYWADKRILVIDKPISQRQHPAKCTADIVIVTHNPQMLPHQLLNMVDCKLVLLDSSNPNALVKKWSAACLRSGIPFHSISEKGAFILNMN